MQKTPFAGLTALDPVEPASTDDSSALSVNPWVIDALLKIGALTHRHDAHAALAPPGSPPAVSVQDAGGTIPADVTISVAYSLLDAFGGETAASGVYTATTQAGLVDPDASPTLEVSNAAGTLLAADYGYAVTVADNAGGESVLGSEATVTIDPGFATNQVLVSGLAAIVAAAGGIRWRLWRQVNGGMWNLIAEGTDDTFTDDGAECVNCNVQPPFETGGASNATNALVISVSALPEGATGFRLYASEGDTFTPVSLLGQYGPDQAATPLTFTTLDTLALGAPLATPTAIGGAHKITADELDASVTALLGSGGGGTGGAVGEWQDLAPLMGGTPSGPAVWEPFAVANDPPQFRIDGDRVHFRGWVVPTEAGWPGSNPGAILTGWVTDALPEAARPLNYRRFIVPSWGQTLSGVAGSGVGGGPSWVLTVTPLGGMALEFFPGAANTTDRTQFAVCLDGVSYIVGS
jgi:hypothetical protein